MPPATMSGETAGAPDSVAAKARVLELARIEGFELVRFASAAPLPAAREAARAAVAGGRLEGMDWITASWADCASDPGRFLGGARSVLLVALACHQPEPLTGPADGAARGRVARYAWGRDYHRVFERRLRRIARRIRVEFGAGARATVDYGPLLERPFAASAGLGWQGKSTMLLVPGLGPWVLLGAVVTTLDLAPDAPLAKSCGSCRRCVAACPTGALAGDGQVLDARLCISYHTIENRGAIPRELRPLFGGWVFGCDDCLTSCPVGASRFDTHPAFLPVSEDDAHPELVPLLRLDADAFEARFHGRAIMRAKRDGFVRNVCVALGNVGTAADLAPLAGALADESPLVRGHAAWALGHLAARAASPEARRSANTALSARLASELDATVREELHAAMREAIRDA